MTRTLLVLSLVLLVPSLVLAEANVSPDAADVLKKVGQAYAKLKTLQLTGKLSSDFEVDGQKSNDQAAFASSFAAPNQFRREIADDNVIGSTGKKLYFYVKDRRLYSMTDGPKDKVVSSELPDPFSLVLGIDATRDFSLALALSSDPAGELGKSYPHISKGDDVEVDGKKYTALKLSKEKDGPATTLLIDPATNLIRRAVFDVSDQFKSKGASDVKKAHLITDYTASQADEPAKAEAFAWAPPPGSKDADEVAMGQDDEDNEAAKALLGKPAPDFKLTDIDGKEVALVDLKGSVVVLDFWATWCGPCVMSLPKIDKLYLEKKEEGLKVFAVNQGEDAQLAQGFVKSKNLSVPVLLDPDQKVNNAYKAEAIPETVVIGKDGIVRKVFVGVGPQTEKKIREAVEAAMKAPK